MMNTPRDSDPVNHNICATCLTAAEPGRPSPSWDVADSGVCGRCGKYADVFDLEVLEICRAAGLSDSQVHRLVPRLRASHGTPGQHAHALEDIRVCVQSAVQAGASGATP